MRMSFYLAWIFIRRRPFRSFISSALLTSVILFGTLALIQRNETAMLRRTVERNYHTIVTLDDRDFPRTQPSGREDLIEFMGYKLAPPANKTEIDLERLHDGLGFVLSIDERSSLIARTNNLSSYSPPPEDDAITEQRFDLYYQLERNPGKPALIAKQLQFNDDHGSMPVYPEPVIGAVRGQIVLIEFLAPFGLRPWSDDRSVFPETLADRGLSPQEVDRSAERSLYDELVYIAYIEIDHDNSALTDAGRNARYLKLRCTGVNTDQTLPFVAGDVVMAAVSGSKLIYNPAERFTENAYLHMMDSEPQWYIEGSLYGQSYEERPEYVLSQDPEREWLAEAGRQRISDSLLRHVQRYTEAAELKVVNYLSEAYPSVLNINSLGVGVGVGVGDDDEGFEAALSRATLPSHSFPVTVTKGIHFLPEFSSGDIYLSEPDYSDHLEEQAHGQPVVYLSDMLAKHNSIQAGDSIGYQFIREGWYTDVQSPGEGSIAREDGYASIGYLRRQFFHPIEHHRLIEEEPVSLTVAGIYKEAPSLYTRYDRIFGYSSFDLFHNQIIVVDPEANIHYGDMPRDYLNYMVGIANERSGGISVELMNGTDYVNEYRAAVKAADLESFIIKIDDNGFSTIELVLEKLISESRRLTTLFIIVGLVLILLYMVVQVQLHKVDDHRLAVLGGSRRMRRISLTILFSFYWLVAGTVGCISAVVYQHHIRDLFNTTISEAVDVWRNDIQLATVFGLLGILLGVFALQLILSAAISRKKV